MQFSLKVTIPSAIVAKTMRFEIPDALSAKMRGAVSRGIKAVEIDNRGHLLFTLTDNSTIDLGRAKTDGILHDKNSGEEITIWSGTMEEYNALTHVDPKLWVFIKEG